jgi:hypothetical protein
MTLPGLRLKYPREAFEEHREAVLRQTRPQNGGIADIEACGRVESDQGLLWG